jgi:hypothetical protein
MQFGCAHAVRGLMVTVRRRISISSTAVLVVVLRPAELEVIWRLTRKWQQIDYRVSCLSGLAKILANQNVQHA